MPWAMKGTCGPEDLRCSTDTYTVLNHLHQSCDATLKRSQTCPEGTSSWMAMLSLCICSRHTPHWTWPQHCECARGRVSFHLPTGLRDTLTPPTGKARLGQGFFSVMPSLRQKTTCFVNLVWAMCSTNHAHVWTGQQWIMFFNFTPDSPYIQQYIFENEDAINTNWHIMILNIWQPYDLEHALS